MRILIANHFSRRVGGIESYLDTVLPALGSTGHTIRLLSEINGSGEPIRLPEGASEWCVADIGFNAVISNARSWRPDLVFAHGLEDVDLEEAMTHIAPMIFFAHGYHGTCVGGHKAFGFPETRPCDRQMGWKCLAYYYPRRCGGLSPVTMWQQYVAQSRRLLTLRRCKAILTASEHMRREYLRHGFAPGTVHVLPLPLRAEIAASNGKPPGGVVSLPEAASDAAANAVPNPSREAHLMFGGRMVEVKGGMLLLDALPEVAEKLDARVRLTLAGDGPARERWQEHAKAIESRNSGVVVDFVGWLGDSDLGALASRVDLLVVPSLWPEPFGLMGPESGIAGVPAAAFASGGIPEWLIEGVNGHLAPSNPPSSSGLARAIVACLGDATHYHQLSVGAREFAARFSLEGHLQALNEVIARSVPGIAMRHSAAGA